MLPDTSQENQAHKERKLKIAIKIKNEKKYKKSIKFVKLIEKD